MLNESSEQPSTKNTLVHPIPVTQANIDQKLFTRDTYGMAAGYAIDHVHCYGRGAEATVAQIEAYAPEACRNLLAQPDPKGNRNALKVFHTSYAPSAKGKPSYIRFSTQWLYDESDPGVTKWGELWINKQLKFNADPTDLDSNR
ncbi:hypothetical protein MMC24_000288 [Lignoscripta atroalba]|nr:hypothetical protein [Lignoscripta atroalba]